MSKVQEIVKNHLLETFVMRRREFNVLNEETNKFEHKNRFINSIANILYYHLEIKDKSLEKFIDQHTIQEYSLEEIQYFYDNFYLPNVDKLIVYTTNLALANELKNIRNVFSNEIFIQLKANLITIYNINSTEEEIFKAIDNITKIGYENGILNELFKSIHIFRADTLNFNIFLKSAEYYNDKLAKKLYDTDVLPTEYQPLSSNINKQSFYNKIASTIYKELHKLYASEYRILAGFEITKTTGNEVFFRGINKSITADHHIGRANSKGFDSLFKYHLPAEFNCKWKDDDASFVTSTSLSLQSTFAYTVDHCKETFSPYQVSFGYILDIRPPKGTEVVNLMRYHTNEQLGHRKSNLEISFDVIDLSWIRAIYEIAISNNEFKVVNVIENPYHTERVDKLDLPLIIQNTTFDRLAKYKRQNNTNINDLPFNLDTHYPINDEHRKAITEVYFKDLLVDNNKFVPSLDVPHILNENGELVRQENYDSTIIKARREKELKRINELLDITLGNERIKVIEKNETVVEEKQQNNTNQQLNGDKRMGKHNIKNTGFGYDMFKDTFKEYSKEDSNQIKDRFQSLMNSKNYPSYEDNHIYHLMNKLENHENLPTEHRIVIWNDGMFGPMSEEISINDENAKYTADSIDDVELDGKVTVMVVHTGSHFQALLVDKLNPIKPRLFYFEPASNGAEPSFIKYLDQGKYEIYCNTIAFQDSSSYECGPLCIEFLMRAYNGRIWENSAITQKNYNDELVTLIDNKANNIPNNKKDFIYFEEFSKNNIRPRQYKLIEISVETAPRVHTQAHEENNLKENQEPKTQSNLPSPENKNNPGHEKKTSLNYIKLALGILLGGLSIIGASFIPQLRKVKPLYLISTIVLGENFLANLLSPKEEKQNHQNVVRSFASNLFGLGWAKKLDQSTEQTQSGPNLNA
ncbi:MAG: hypothetical protein J0H68_05250 [Sphingobacteriia bacterium]|nr:hypothetical protein [Sphingobacteriia bacterium]